VQDAQSARRRAAASGGTAPTTWRALLSVALLVFAAVFSVAPARAAEGDSLTVSLLTMGPGEHPFTKFGHSAIWVHDARTNQDEV